MSDVSEQRRKRVARRQSRRAYVAWANALTEFIIAAGALAIVVVFYIATFDNIIAISSAGDGTFTIAQGRGSASIPLALAVLAVVLTSLVFQAYYRARRKLEVWELLEVEDDE